MELQLVVVCSGSVSSVARVAPATATALGAGWSSFVLLVQTAAGAAAPPNAFRLEVDTAIPPGAVHVDHWPGAAAASAAVSVTASVVAPAQVRAVQFLELSPAVADVAQPHLARAFVKRLLRHRVLLGARGVVSLESDGIDYGRWRFAAYCRPRAADAATEEISVVDEQTLVLLLPEAASRPVASQRVLLPIGAHGERFREFVAMALATSPVPSARGKDPERSHAQSVLLHGASGAGKTTLAQLVALQFGANLLSVDCSLLATRHVQLQDLFTAALRVQPTVLVLEDLELLFPRVLDAAKYKLVGRLVGCVEAINDLATASVAVVGTVTTLSALHSRVRQLFAEEVTLEMPERQWTADLLRSLLPPALTLSDELLLSVAVRYGQRPSNIASIARQVVMRLRELEREGLAMSPAVLESEIESFARETASTSALATSVPDVSWSDIGGLVDVKQSLLEMVVWPLERPHMFLRMGISPPLGMILHGPPGTGKTMLAKAAARASGCNFVNLSASDLMKAEFGESEKAIARAFDAARALSPCMVFIDEFQSLFGDRSTAGVTTSRMISQLLVEMDSLKAVAEDRRTHYAAEARSTSAAEVASSVASRVFVLAATNALAAIDPAFLQPGRFENVVYVGLPNDDERRAILEIQKAKMPWHEDVDLSALVDATVNANAASLVALCQAATIEAMQRLPPEVATDDQVISMEDFVAALEHGNFDFGAREGGDDGEDHDDEST